MAVNLPGPLHQREFVRALLCPDRGHLRIYRFHFRERQVLLHPLDLGDRDKIGLKVHLSRDLSRTRRYVPVAPHLPEVWKERLVYRPLVVLPNPEDGIAVLRDEQETVRHGTREVVEGNLTGDGCHLPAWLRPVHPGPETVQPVVKFSERDFHFRSIMWQAMVFIGSETGLFLYRSKKSGLIRP